MNACVPSLSSPAYGWAATTDEVDMRTLVLALVLISVAAMSDTEAICDKPAYAQAAAVAAPMGATLTTAMAVLNTVGVLIIGLVGLMVNSMRSTAQQQRKTLDRIVAIGEMSETKSFYYRSKHHDPIRKRALKRLVK